MNSNRAMRIFRIANLLRCAAVFVVAMPIAAMPLTRQQGDAILEELKQIRHLLERQQQRPATTAPAPTPAPPPAPEKLSLKLGKEYALGQSNAPVTIVEFNDLQCPFCKIFHNAAFNDIKKNYVDTGKVRFINRDLPLDDLHPQATRAAHAARCAGEQGKYWEVAGALIVNQAGMSPASIDQHARKSGIDDAAYQSCMQSNRHDEAIRASGLSARALGISGTPTFIVGRMDGDTLVGKKLVGAVPFASFEKIIKEMLGEK